MKPFFFLSYARTPNKVVRHLQLKLFQGIVDALEIKRDTLRAQYDAIGFLDHTEIKLGDSWPDALAEALQHCRVFLYVQTRAYFEREWCGREWAVFNDRINRFMNAPTPTGSRPPLMLPILWDPSPDAGRFANAYGIHYDHAEFGARYATEGIAQWLNQDRHRDRRKDFLARLAERMLEAADKYNLPPDPRTPTDLRSVASAFHDGVLAAKGGASPTIEKTGPKRVVFVYVVGTRAELEVLGNGSMLGAYGDASRSLWRPFYPPIEQTIDDCASEVVNADENLSCEKLDVGPDLVASLQRAEKDNKVIILVVDRWSLRFPAYEGLMSDFDQYQFRNCCVVVPWHQDPETGATANEEEVMQKLQKIFSRSEQVPERIHFGSRTPEALKDAITKAIYRAQKRAFDTIFRAAEAPGLTPAFGHKPVIDATAGAR